MRKRTKRRLLYAILGGAGTVTIAGVCAVVWAGSVLAAPAHRQIGEPPADLLAETVSFDSDSGATLHGIGPEHLRPIEGISRVRCPILLLAGTHDMRTTIQESRDLYAAAPQPKEMWEIQGAAHVDFHQHEGAQYETRIGAFLARHLRK